MSDTNPTPTPEASTPVSTPTESTPAPAPATPAPDFRVTGSTTATDLRRELSDVLKFVESDGLKTVAITRHGKVVAAVVGGTEFKLLQRLKESAKSLAPKLGLTVEALLNKLASFEPPIAFEASVDFVEPSQLPAVMEAAEKAESVDLKEVLVPVAAPGPTEVQTSPDAVPSTFEN